MLTDMDNLSLFEIEESVVRNFLVMEEGKWIQLNLFGTKKELIVCQEIGGEILSRFSRGNRQEREGGGGGGTYSLSLSPPNCYL